MKHFFITVIEFHLSIFSFRGSGGSNVPNVIVDRDVDSDDDEDLFVAKEEDIHSDHIASVSFLNKSTLKINY